MRVLPVLLLLAVAGSGCFRARPAFRAEPRAPISVVLVSEPDAVGAARAPNRHLGEVPASIVNALRDQLSERNLELTLVEPGPLRDELERTTEASARFAVVRATVPEPQLVMLVEAAARPYGPGTDGRSWRVEARLTGGGAVAEAKTARVSVDTWMESQLEGAEAVFGSVARELARRIVIELEDGYLVPAQQPRP